jgi:hypothetical protein
MSKFSVTLESMRKAYANVESYNRLVLALQGKPFIERDSYIDYDHAELIPLTTVLEHAGIDNAIWALRCVDNANREIRLFSIQCARQVEHLMNDPRSVYALEIAADFAEGAATLEELRSAHFEAWEAWEEAKAASNSPFNAALCAAASTARDPSASSWVAATAAFDAAQDAATAAGGTVAAWGAARQAQREFFTEMCNGTAAWL